MRAQWLLVLMVISSSVSANPLRVCVGDVNVWPPFTYWQGSLPEEKAQSLTGSATTLVLQALEEQEIEYQLYFMPWARVQQELAQEKGRCDLTWDASYRSDRATYSYFSVPLYTIQLGYFTLAQSDKTLNSSTEQDVLCGVNGFNYQDFALPREPSLYLSSVQSALNMLQKERCTWFVSEIEPVYGGAQLGLYRLDRPIQHHFLGKSKQYHIQVSRRVPSAMSLLNKLNQSLLQAQESGEAKAIFDRFLLIGQPE